MLRRHSFLPALAGALFLSALAGTLSGQVTGRATGSVLDPSGSAVPDAAVNLLLPGGSRPVLTAVTTSEGLFHLTGVPPGFYDLVVEARGFSKYVLRGIKVEPGRETALLPARLTIPPVAEVVKVTTSAESVQTENPEVSTTVTSEQVRKLPALDRAPLFLIGTQAGVSFSGAEAPAVINGQRTSFTNITFEGINVQFNWFRNTINISPNDPLLDQVSEFTIATSNANGGGGASQIALATPSGTNRYHGSGYWYNRNDALAANTWFNNRDGIERPFLNQNQVGGSLGGPILRDRLFFYSNYEAARLRQHITANQTILTEDARRGIFTYQDLAGAVRKVNILQAAGVPLDPTIQQKLDQVPGPEKINNFRAGDSGESLLRNTAGYSFLRRNNETRDNLTAKLDYLRSARHVFSGSFAWNRVLGDDPFNEGYSQVPKGFLETGGRLLSLAWRWNPAPRFTNELRGGFNRPRVLFDNREKLGPFILANTVFTSPQESEPQQGFDVNTYNYADNAHYVRGKHSLQFGFQVQQVHARPFDDFGTIPTYIIGIGTGNPGLTASQLPGIRASDIDAANQLLATLAGYVTGYFQTFNITSRSSGFVNGAPNVRHFTLNNYSPYVQDTWKLRRLALTLGLRYDYYSVVDERDSLVLLPKIENNSAVATLLSNATLDFAGSSAGRPWYRKDKNNFAPNIGLAWNVFGDGKTAVRAAYGIYYVNDETLFALASNPRVFNAGLRAFASRFGLSARISTGLPAIPTPSFQVPRTLQDNFQVDPGSAVALIDPGLVTPYVQEWSIGIQQALKGALLEVRYVGNHGVKLLRGIDLNQVEIRRNGFLDDFQRALNNGNLARQATGVFNPNYNPAIPGSQPLPVFGQLVGGGLLDDSFIQNLIETGQAGDLAATYQFSGLNGPVNFFPNPFALGGAFLVNNYSYSSYNALQVDVRRRAPGGLQFQANYTFSKVLSDSTGLGSLRLEPFLDLNNPKIERARAPYDLTHAIKANAILDLPFGQGHRLNARSLGRVLTGWAASGVMTWQSGGAFSVLSGRGTLNQSGLPNTADTNLNKSQLDRLFGFRQTSNGPSFVAASAIGPDGRAVAPDGTPPFAGQVFFHPAAGTIGALQRRMFSGPWTFNLDFALLKDTKISERQSLELRMDATNVLNHPRWTVNDQFISSPSFGRIGPSPFGSRLVQLGLYYLF